MQNSLDQPLLELLSPKVFAKKYLETHQIEVLLNGRLKAKNGEERDLIEGEIYVEFIQKHTATGQLQKILKQPIPRYDRKTFTHAMDSIINMAIRDHLEKRKTELRCEGEDLSAIRTWVKAVTGKDSELDVMKVAQFIWQIKRKFFGLPVTHHLLVHVFGPQGVGKSTAIRQLVKAMNPLVLKLDTTDLTDTRLLPALQRNYVGFLDEFDYPDKVSIESLKSLLTGDEKSYRKLYTNYDSSATINITVISAANRHIQEIIVDPTGMRRYAELVAGPTIDYDVTKDFDSDAAFRGVNELDEVGYSHRVRSQLEDEQKAMTMKDDIEMFLEDFNIKPEEGSFKEVTSQSLYELYREFCENGKFVQLNKKWFLTRLANKKVLTMRRTTEKKVTVVLYKVNSDCRAKAAKTSLNELKAGEGKQLTI
jgi:hypothetical protein